MNPIVLENSRTLTARRRIATILTKEILSNTNPKDFPIASEHQLCRRFSVSRVTIRLALGDLQHRGLIYRQHGKGTFAHGCSSRVHRNLGILLKSPDALQHSALIEFIRGVQTVATSLNSSLVLTSTSPLNWPREMASTLGGVIVTYEGITDDEVAVFQTRKLPSICIRDSELFAGKDDSFNLGLCTAKTLYHTAISGEPTGIEE